MGWRSQQAARKIPARKFGRSVELLNRAPPYRPGFDLLDAVVLPWVDSGLGVDSGSSPSLVIH